MGKEYKRYYLTSYSGTRETTVQTNSEYEELLRTVNNYNKREYNKRKKDKNGKYKPRTRTKYLYGNITREDTKDGIHVVAHLYTKLTKAMDIKDLLNYTSQFEKEELAQEFKGQTGTAEGYIPDINIAYLENKNKGSEEEIHYDRRIKYLPVLYKSDRKYMSKEYLLKCLEYHVNNRNFGILKGLANELCFDKKSAEELEKVYRIIDKCEHQNYSLDFLYTVCKDLIEKYISEVETDGTIKRDEDGVIVNSVRRVLDVGMYFKYCMSSSKRHSPVKYNEGPTEEMKEKLKREAEERRVLELIKSGNYHYEQMSLF